MRILIALVFILAVNMPLTAAAYPTLEAPAAYTALASNGDAVYNAFLRLQDDYFFVLHERVSRAGKTVEQRSRTGIWRQLGDGGVLQLASRNGPTSKLNVGGGGNLYGDMRMTKISTANVIFKQTADSPRPYTVYGLLSFENDTITLTDSASGRVFSVDPDPRLAKFAARNSKFFIQADVETAPYTRAPALYPTTLRLISLHGASTSLPKQAPPTARLFRQIVTDGVWRLSARGLPPLDCVFTPSGEKTGTFTVSGQGIRLRARYEIDDIGKTGVIESSTVSFKLNTDDALALRASGHEALLRLLKGTGTWEMEGDLLVFSHKRMALCVLEKTGEFSEAPMARAMPPARNAQQKAMPGAPVTALKPDAANTGQVTWTQWSVK